MKGTVFLNNVIYNIAKELLQNEGIISSGTADSGAST